ncbi:MAG TPA: apolipoprotein N-acyltransferase, partial [bacterium]|nr:apolipoprotein N-acyltransferase [bacterium]
SAEYYNAALVIRPDNTQLGNYEKVHLVPFGEFVPSFLKFLDAIAMEVGASNYTPGDSVHAFTIPLYSDSIPTDSACITAVICLESIFPYLVREGLERDAQALVIVTNDSWYDGTMAPEQHARIAVLRAIEFRTAVARCANSGVSNAIDPYGRITAKLDNGLQGVLYATIPLQTSTSIYMRWGDWFAHSLWMIITLSLCFLFFYKPSKRD